MAGIFIERPGYAQSFPLPAVDLLLSSIALPSSHVFERQAQEPIRGTWFLDIPGGGPRIALPVDPDEHSTQITPSMAIQRGMESDVQTSSGIRSGTISLRGTVGLKLKLGWDSDGYAIYGQGNALSNHLRGWFLNFVKRAKACNPFPVRLVYRNLDQGDSYVVVPTLLHWSRGQNSRFAYEYAMDFRIVAAIEPSPILPGWMQWLEDAATAFESAVLTAQGYVAALSTVADNIGRVLGNVIQTTMVSPLRNTTYVLNDLAEGTRNMLQTPVQAIEEGIQACYGLSEASRQFALVVSGKVEESDPAVDPEDDPDRTATKMWIGTAQDAYDTADSLASVQLALYARQEPGRQPTQEVSASDDAETLGQKVNRTPGDLLLEMGSVGPVVDPEGALPESLWPGEQLAMAATVPSDGPAGSGASGVSPAVFYGTNLEMSADGDLVPEIADNPQDVRLVSGLPNLMQGLSIIIETHKRRNLTFPWLGIEMPIGDQNVLSPVVYAEAVDAILGDDRVRSAHPIVQSAEGDKIQAVLRITPWGKEGPLWQGVNGE